MHTNTATSSNTLATALTAIAAAAPLGFAQPTAIDPPRWVTITETAQLRCAPGSIWYPVAVLEPGTTLRADATEDGWLRVNYPADTPALALARNAELNQNTRTVTITRRTGLRALNLNYPAVETSFKPLFSRDLPPVGTTLDYLATITNDQGQPVAFRVRAPQDAKGFVLQASTRDATEAEIDAASQPSDSPADDQNNQPNDDQQPEPRADADSQSQQPPTTERTQPANPDDASEPRPDAEPTPQETPEQPEDARAQPDAEPQPDPDTEVPTQTMGERSADDLQGSTPRQRLTRIFQRLEALDQRFNAVRNQPPGTTEAAPLIAEYRRLVTAAQPTVVADQVEQVANARITILEVRTELAEALRDVDQAQERTLAADERLDRLARTAALPVAYAAVGRLVPSSVYDGQNGLPLRYRLQIDTTTNTSNRTRTVAYIEPNDTFDPATIATLLGLRVGIDGDMRTAAGTAVPIINPSRLEALEPTPTDG